MDFSLVRDLFESIKWDLVEVLRVFEMLFLGFVVKYNENISGDNNRVMSGKVKRGFLMVNFDIVVEVRFKVIEDKILGIDDRYECFEEMFDFIFVLFDLFNFFEELSDFFCSDLIEILVLVVLE